MRSKEEQERIIKRALSMASGAGDKSAEISEPLIASVVEEGRIIAVEIDSTVLAACIWLAFDDDIGPKDGQAVFYVHELEFLKNKTPEQLRKIHALKLGANGLGTKVRQ